VTTPVEMRAIQGCWCVGSACRNHRAGPSFRTPATTTSTAIQNIHGEWQRRAPTPPPAVQSEKGQRVQRDGGQDAGWFLPLWLLVRSSHGGRPLGRLQCQSSISDRCTSHGVPTLTLAMIESDALEETFPVAGHHRNALSETRGLTAARHQNSFRQTPAHCGSRAAT
jgi:hypothetical protein